MFFYEKFVKILFVLVGEVMRYLGLDLGTRTLGVAISDTSHIIASPLTVIRFPEGQYEIALEELKKILDEYQISKIALGLPKNMNGSEGFASERSRLFKELLEQNIDIPVYLVDERLSTMEAENILLEVDLSRKKRKKVIDGVAAVIILETFIKMEENK
ncbi:putative Holliday junction resolvase [Mycoplasma sp. CAG:776]|nr:putative Holliday junction resolvase [Mycoplasma sp. CAG:776]